MLGDVLQLSDIARPFVFQHQLLCFGRELEARQTVFLHHLEGEEPEQQNDVVAPLSQWRHADGYGVEAVVEVFAESSFADGLRHVDVCCCHNAHVGLLYFHCPHRNVFSRFEHSQQPCLCGQRQFAHLVEEEGAFVGRAEIAWRVADGSCERAFDVSEQLAVDGAFGN